MPDCPSPRRTGSRGARETLETRARPAGNLHADQDASVVGALVAVVEQADVPVAAACCRGSASARPAAPGTRSGRGLVRARRRAAADHVAHVQLGHLVVGQVERRRSPWRRELREQLRRSRARLATSTPTKTCASRGSAIAVVELGDVALAEQRAERAGSCPAARGSSPRASPRAARRARRARRRSAGGRSSCWRRRRPRRASRRARRAARPTPSRPRRASAPAGSSIARVSSNTSLIAAQISSVSTSTTSSTSCAARRNVSRADLASPRRRRRTARRASSCTRRPASSERAIASASSARRR